MVNMNHYYFTTFMTRVLVYTLILSLALALPLPALGKTVAPAKNTVTLVSTDHTNANHSMIKLLELIRSQLTDEAHVLPIQTSGQLSSTSQSDDPKLNEAISLMTHTMDQYSNYQASEKETLTAINSLIYFMTHEVPPSRQCSELIHSAVLTKAWLQFKSGDKTSSTATLDDFTRISTSTPIDLSYFPPNFRKFTEKHLQSGKNTTTKQSITLASTPTGADVFINHKHVGIAPVTIEAPLDETITIGFTITGRKTAVKSVLITGKTKKIKSHLSWDSKSTPTQKPWHALKPKAKIMLASQLSAASKSDQIILFEAITRADGMTPTATVFDARYSQLMKTISYPKTITESSMDQSDVAKFFSDKLKPYLKSDSINYWQGSIDKSQILDHRIASRGKKPLHKNTPFLLAGAGVLLAGTITAIVLATSGGGNSPQDTGGVTINFNGL